MTDEEVVEALQDIKEYGESLTKDKGKPEWEQGFSAGLSWYQNHLRQQLTTKFDL